MSRYLEVVFDADSISSARKAAEVVLLKIPVITGKRWPGSPIYSVLTINLNP